VTALTVLVGSGMFMAWGAMGHWPIAWASSINYPMFDRVWTVPQSLTVLVPMAGVVAITGATIVLGLNLWHGARSPTGTLLSA
jgi:hypothetical protein